MNEHITNALICLKDDFGIEYVVCKITYTICENEEFEYRFRPIYPVIELLDSSVFQGIPGMDLDSRKPEYVRKNIVPTFISERAPGKNREELWKLLEDCGMQYLNQLEWLCRTETQYAGDRLYVRKSTAAFEEPVSVSGSKRSVDVQKSLLNYICAGRSFSYEGFFIDDSNRTVCYHLLYRLYRGEAERLKQLQLNGVRKAREEGRYQGRKAIPVEGPLLDELVRKFRSGQISAADAAKRLGVSVRTFYRRMKNMP